VPEILADHQRMDQAWLTLRPELDAIAAGTGVQLSAHGVRDYVAAYQAHMARKKASWRRWPSACSARSRWSSWARHAAPPRHRARCRPRCNPAALLAAMRTDYVQSSLSETDVLADPIAQFQKWFAEAVNAQVMSRTP
jgi:pyridoxamine 5'-phosphate oxidase